MSSPLLDFHAALYRRDRRGRKRAILDGQHVKDAREYLGLTQGALGEGVFRRGAAVSPNAAKQTIKRHEAAETKTLPWDFYEALRDEMVEHDGCRPPRYDMVW